MDVSALSRLKDSVLCCLDVGREQGWFALDLRSNTDRQGTSTESFRDFVGEHLRNDRLCVVGLEAAGFIPLESDYSRLTRARVGETDFGQSRPWSVHAGKAAAWRAIPLMPALLRNLRDCVTAQTYGHLDFARAGDSDCRMLLFEAFITGAPSGQVAPSVPDCVSGASCHVWDAAIAVQTLHKQIDQAHLVSGIRDQVSLSLYGAALLASKWSADSNLTLHPVHVVRSFKPTVAAALVTI